MRLEGPSPVRCREKEPSRQETLVCATDAGGAKRTRKMADELQAPHKCRTDKLLAASCSRVLCAVLA